MTVCGVVGGGAWGTALGNALARSGHEVRLWALEPDVVSHINTRHANPRFLPGCTLDPRLVAVEDIGHALERTEVVLWVSPSHVLRDVARRGAARGAIPTGAVMVVATKGIEQGSLAIMTDVVTEEVGSFPVVALSGPSFAAEVATGQPTAIVAASRSAAAANVVQEVFRSTQLRVYTHDDVTGVELGGALKNVMALATGIAEGLGLGLNTRAALITRGLAEMSRLGMALGAREETFAGLAGLGDLVLTCTGALSRNRSVGLELGRGVALEQILAGKESVAEGVSTARSALDLAATVSVEMPIASAVGRILFEGCRARDSISELMGRELRPERDQ
ncbi:MAG: NAD(P)H-dependent glycerol-3-phosphate dehydrogenase [Gemmatimonadota bacterium]